MDKLQENFIVPIEISARHIHLSQNDADIIFGTNYIFTNLNNLSQPKQFATTETVDIIGPKKTISNVRIIAPVRSNTQLEISVTDSFTLGIKQPNVLLSGHLKNSSGGIIIKGPKGEINLKNGVIVAKRHLHIDPNTAKNLNISSGDIVSIKTQGERSIIFENVVVRSSENDKLSFQLDTDEANAANVKNGDKGIII